MKAKKAFEHVYIYITGAKTVVDGDVVMLFCMDGYSEFIMYFKASKAPVTDNVLMNILQNVFDETNKQYKPFIHSKTTLFITNLPSFLEPEIKPILKQNQRIIFNEELTVKNTKRMVAAIEKELGG